MNSQKDPHRQTRSADGVGGVFGRRELKSFFVNYLVTILVIEGLIFFVCFVTALAGEQAQFPWKPYVFASFTAPIAITFIFAIIILAFNRYIFRSPDQKFPSASTELDEDNGKVGQYLQLIQKVPFLLSLLLLIVACWIGYNMDAIALFAARAGESALRYFLISFVVVLGVVTVFALLWLVFSYRLRMQKMTRQQQYRQDVMERLGLVILEDNTVLDREGNQVFIAGPGGTENERAKEDVRLLPRINRE